MYNDDPIEAKRRRKVKEAGKRSQIFLNHFYTVPPTRTLSVVDEEIL